MPSGLRGAASTYHVGATATVRISVAAMPRHEAVHRPTCRSPPASTISRQGSARITECMGACEEALEWGGVGASALVHLAPMAAEEEYPTKAHRASMVMCVSEPAAHQPIAESAMTCCCLRACCLSAFSLTSMVRSCRGDDLGPVEVSRLTAAFCDPWSPAASAASSARKASAKPPQANLNRAVMAPRIAVTAWDMRADHGLLLDRRAQQRKAARTPGAFLARRRAALGPPCRYAPLLSSCPRWRANCVRDPSVTAVQLAIGQCLDVPDAFTSALIARRPRGRLPQLSSQWMPRLLRPSLRRRVFLLGPWVRCGVPP